MAKSEPIPPLHPTEKATADVAVLVSGGVDSAVLLGECLETDHTVQPLFVQSGLFWEAEELRHLDHFLEAIRRPSLLPLVVLDVPVADLYGPHWSMTGIGVPDADSTDAAVYLPGRNVMLLSKSMLWCHLHGVPRIALGILEANPFPDATLEFVNAFQEVINRAIDGKVVIQTPFVGLSKGDVINRGRHMPLDLTFSCIRPNVGTHCGQCNKCAERRRAFTTAGLRDSTPYAMEKSCTA